jgi:hypothetical protein
MSLRVGSFSIRGITLQSKPIRHRRPPASDVTPDTPIWCPACQEVHRASAFNRESRKHSGLFGICREAQRVARQTTVGKDATVKRNRRRWADPAYRDKSKEWTRHRRLTLGATYDLTRSRARLQTIVLAWKKQGCADCGYDDERAIEPDHRTDEVKSGNLSRMVQMCASEERIRFELEKCIPRCVRCHRRVTQEQRPCAWRSADWLPPSWRRRLDTQDLNDTLKMIFGCLECGWREWPRGLDWDHVMGDKVANVSQLIASSRPWLEISKEIAKCDCVCANCHRIRTIERLESG